MLIGGFTFRQVAFVDQGGKDVGIFNVANRSRGLYIRLREKLRSEIAAHKLS
jgi:hypothetical protein